MPVSIFLQKSSGIAIFILASLLAYQCAQLTWSFFASEQQQYKWVAPKKTTNNSQINTHKLQQQHLFGEVVRTTSPSQPTKSVSIAPKTKLNVTLVGVVAASDPNYSSAIISYKGKQGSYFIESEITGTNASVAEIYDDRVILSVDGALQTLLLDGVDKDKTASTSRSRTTPRRSRPDPRPVEVELDRQQLLDDPSKLTDYIRISPYRKDGEVLGYRLRAGKNPELFTQAGFEKNDLAVELNGVDLTDTQQAFALMKEFPTMTDINVTVEREGQLYELSLNIP